MFFFFRKKHSCGKQKGEKSERFITKKWSIQHQERLADNTKHGCKCCKRNVTLRMKQQPSNVLLLEEYLQSEEIVHVKREIWYT